MQARAFNGVPYVGAVFSSKNGQPGNYFATAFVVTSKSGSILMSAAHILLNRNAADLLFIPGYAQGRAPPGVWPISESYVTAARHNGQNIDDDFCFLKLRANIQGTVGSLNLLTDAGPQTCEVIGYPDGLKGPVHATVPAAWYLPRRQLVFNCGGYQQGGDSSATSHSPYFGDNVRALYNTAIATT